MKEHEVAKLINDLTEIARTYGHTQQLRERISYRVHEALIVSAQKPKANSEDVITITKIKCRERKPKYLFNNVNGALSEVK